MIPLISDFFSWIGENTTALGVVVAFIVAIFPVIQYVLVRKSENRKHTFEAYHKSIGDLVDPPTPRLDRQIAVVYELRNFKSYFPVTLRILEGLKISWSNNPTTNDLGRLIQEIDLTISFIKKKQRFLPLWKADRL